MLAAGPLRLRRRRVRAPGGGEARELGERHVRLRLEHEMSAAVEHDDAAVR
jgi:hypothetical protein